MSDASPATEFRRRFRTTFGCDVPGAAIELALPRLRFELAARAGDDALDQALVRCRDLFAHLFGDASGVWTELRFDGNADAPVQLARLEEAGLRPLHPTQWTHETHVENLDGDTFTEERVSAVVAPDSPGFETLFRAIVHLDHGGYDGFSVRALMADFDRGLGYDPYDDRGADVFARDARALVPVYRAFSDWILDFDRSRICRELGLDDDGRREDST